MPLRSKYRTRRSHPKKTDHMPITPRKNIAAAVAALRQIDACNGTDRAIAEVAETFHLAPETVAQIAAEESHAEALFENRRQDANACRDCGACASNCGRREIVAAGIEAEAVPY